MTLPSSGTLSLNQIHVEAGGSSASLASINDSDIRGLIGKGSAVQMSFNEWYGASAASGTISFIGSSSTTTGNFANGNRTLSSGNKLVVVVSAHTMAVSSNTSTNPTSVLCGGVAMTKAVGGVPHYNASTGIGTQTSIWYLETTQSGSTLISGNSGGTGAQDGVAYTYEISGYTSNTPYATASASTSTNALNETIAVDGQSGGVTFVVGGFAGPGTATVSGGNLSISQQTAEGFAQYVVATASIIGSGSTTYTVNKTSNTGTNSAFSLHAVSFG